MLQVLTIDGAVGRRAGARSAAWMPRNGPRQLTRQLPSKPVGRLVGERRTVQHTGVVDQRGQRAEAVDHRARPPSSHCSRRSRPAGSRPRVVAESVDRGCRNSSTSTSHAATRKPSASSRVDDRRALPAGRAGDQRDAVGRRRSVSIPSLRCGVVPDLRLSASARCAAAPRRSACDSDASVIIRKPSLRHGVSDRAVAGVDAGDQPGRVAAARGCAPSRRARRMGPRVGQAVAHRDRQIGGADVDARQARRRRRSRRRAARPLAVSIIANTLTRGFQRGDVDAQAGAQRPEAAHPGRRVPGRGDRRGGLLGRLDHRDDDGVGSGVEHPADRRRRRRTAAAPRWRSGRARAGAASARRRRRRDSRADSRIRRSRSRPGRTPRARGWSGRPPSRPRSAARRRARPAVCSSVMRRSRS